MKKATFSLIAIILLAAGVPGAFADRGTPEPGAGEPGMTTPHSSGSLEAQAATSGRRRGIERPAEIIRGVVLRLTSSGLTVRTKRSGDIDVTVGAATMISEGSRVVALAQVIVGDSVRLEAMKRNGLLEATEIEIELDDTEITGTVVSVSSDSLVIQTATGSELVFTSTATLVFIDGLPGALADIEIGRKAEIDAVTQPDSTLMATVIRIEDENEIEDVELHGVLTAMTAGSLTILSDAGNSVVVTVTADTQFRKDEEVVTTSALRVGDRLEIEVVDAGDGTLSALVVKIEDEDEPLELKGTILSILPDSLILQRVGFEPIVILLAPDTIVRSGDTQLSLADLEAGLIVEIKASLGPDGSPTAALVKIEDANDDNGGDDDSVELHGVVTDISGSVVTVRVESGNLVAVRVGAETIVTQDDVEVPFSQLAVEDEVEIRTRIEGDGSLTAVQIKIESEDEPGDDDDNGERIEFSGSITAIAGSSIKVLTASGEKSVLVDSNTSITRSDVEVPFSELAVGTEVRVKARDNGDGTLTATEIEVEDEPGDDDEGGETVEIRGTVTAITADSLTVSTDEGSVDVIINGDTIFFEDNEVVDRSVLNTGDEVEISAERQADSSLLALEVEIKGD